jgi:hypothetical protein
MSVSTILYASYSDEKIPVKSKVVPLVAVAVVTFHKPTAFIEAAVRISPTEKLG